MSNERGLIEKINRQVNQMDLRENVDIGLGAVLGGCRQYVLEKRRRLIAEGIDPARLEPWTVVRPPQGSDPGGLHGVLVLDGKTVLDNLNAGWTVPKADITKGPHGYLFVAPWVTAQ
jgi:predicted transglutaminase-like cysteine proteinase